MISLTSILLLTGNFQKMAQQQLLPGIKEEPRPMPSDIKGRKLTLLEQQLQEAPYSTEQKELPGIPEAQDWKERDRIRKHRQSLYNKQVELPTPGQVPPIEKEHLVPVEHTKFTEPSYSFEQPRPEEGSEKVSPEFSEKQEVLRTEFLKAYNRFREYYITVFYRAYQEAIMMMSEEIPEPNVENLTIEEILRQFSKYATQQLKPVVGKLFGIRRGEGRWETKSKLQVMKEMLQGKGLENLHRIYQETGSPGYYYGGHQTSYLIERLQKAVAGMKITVEEFERLKRLEKKAEKGIAKEIDDYLNNEHNKKLLKWMNKTHPEVKNIIINRLRETTSLKEISSILKNTLRTFTAAYEKIGGLVFEAYTETQQDIKSSEEIKIVENIRDKLKEKMDPILELIPAIFSDNLNTFERTPENVALVNNVYQNVIEAFKKIDINISSLEGYIKNNKNLTLLQSYFRQPSENREPIDFAFKVFFLHNLIINKMHIETVSRYDIGGPLTLQSTQKEKEIFTTEWANTRVTKWLLLALPTGYFHASEFSRDIEVNVPNLNEPAGLLKRFQSLNPGDIYKKLIPLFTPVMSPELAFQFVRHVFRERKISDFTDYKIPTVLILSQILAKLGKLDLNNLIKLWQNVEVAELQQIVTDFPAKLKSKAIDIITKSIRSVNTLETDLKNFRLIVREVHNSGANISPKLFELLLTNPNMRQVRNIDMVKKLYEIVVRVGGLGGLNKFQQEYGPAIKAGRSRKLISRSFMPDLRAVLKLFTSDTIISPAMEDAKGITALLNKVKSELELSVELQEYVELYEKAQRVKKIPELFKLNYKINDRLRFRVLKDLDPMYLKVGRETGCCQYAGGAGEKAMEDSFINPEAGVVVLEWLNPENQWVILSQSYFHYDKNGKGYILDNVETNEDRIRQSGIKLEKVYIYWAQHIKTKLKLQYMEAGAGYSDLDRSQSYFKWHKTKSSDPRNFAVTDPYRDWHHGSANIDLLAPKVKLTNENPKTWGYIEQEASTEE